MTRDWIQKIHTYAGLLTFVNLMVYGVVGIAGTLQRPPREQPFAVRSIEYTVAPNLTDREVAERVCDLLHLSLATPIQKEVIQRDRDNHLLLDFWHVNGRHRVTVLEKENQLRVEERRNGFWAYLGDLHATTAAFRAGDRRMQVWAVYNEFAMWCLVFMILSGVALWLMSRPRYRWAQWSLALGCGLFALLCFLTR